MLSVLGRLHRAGELSSDSVLGLLDDALTAPVKRKSLASLITGAWHSRHNFHTVDALYVELALQLKVTLIMTDKKLANATGVAEFIGA